MANFEVQISMDAATVEALQNGNFSLYGFKAVQTNQGGGAPLVWFKSQNISLTTQVAWQTQYQAYVSNSAIIPNGTITASNEVDIDLGQTWQVQQTGDGPVVDGGPARAISILNESSRPWTTGISQVVDGAANPLCAFPLYGHSLDVIAPIEKVLLTFATEQVNTGTVIFQSFSQSILIDLTSANQRNVTFNINNGWSWGGFNWGRTVPASTDLVPFLIESPAFAPDPEAGFAHNALVLE